MPTKEVRLPVDHVSDTAYMVALQRGEESEREDAKFKDPLAAVLGAPKAEILKQLPFFREEGRWLITVRTCLLDEHILRLVAEGPDTAVDTVVNLAAGLDTRPYRLELPRNLRWIEADFPGLIEYKNERLQLETPKCQLERIGLDLADDSARAELFSYFDKNAKRTLVITEGLLPYLSESSVMALSVALRGTRTVTHWLMDVTMGDFLKRFADRLKSESVKADVLLKFSSPLGVHYFERFGWRVHSFDSFVEGGEKLGLKVPDAYQAASGPATGVWDSGVAELVRA